jgi:hypothetical protein
MPAPPPLETGDHLTRDEFERRYEAMPHVNKAELIEGVVYMPSPVRLYQHGGPHADTIGWMVVYRAGTPGTRVGDNSTVRLDLENEPQPDALMYVEPAFGGQVVISPDDYIEGSPEMVSEISASSASFDLHTKLRVYRRNRVQEYLVWRVLDQTIDWFALHGTQYDRLVPGPDGVLRSEVFPGLWLDLQAMIHSDLAKVLQVLQQGLASPEHAAFVTRLQQAARKA